MLLLIDNYDSFTYNLYQYFEELGHKTRVVRNDKISIAQIKKINPSAIILSPGPGIPQEAGICVELVQELYKKFPILGICLGHQSIAFAFGGKIKRCKRLMHGKTSLITHNNLGIYKKIPNPFTATRYHSLIVDKKELPREFSINCQSEDGTIMGIQHKRYHLVGIQYHPESIMTENGKIILNNFMQKIRG